MRTVVGTMTGTSMDGVDAVAAAVDGVGETMSVSFIKMASYDLAPLTPTLRKLATIGGTKKEMDKASLRLGEITTKVIQKLQIEHIDLIALHGQTIYHDPPKSIQLIDPTPVIDEFDCTVLTNPRQSDLELGGQGAPITPLADWIMFRSNEHSTAIVNLGGFCNITILPSKCLPKQILGFDVCCCNLVLNEIARVRLGCEYDENGNEALRGSIDSTLFELVICKLEEQKNSGASLGTEDDLGEFVLAAGDSLATKDLLATTVAAISTCISESLRNVDRVFLAGGGVHHRALMNSIQNNGTTETLGVPTQAREAMAMAILGALSQDGVSITLPQITGRQESKTIVGWVQASP